MVAFAQREPFGTMSIMPPSFDFAAALAAVSNVREVVRAVDELEANMATWRASMMANLRSEEAVVRVAARVAIETSNGLAIDRLVARTAEVRAGIRTASESMHGPVAERPEVVEGMATLTSRSPEIARIFRKQIKRAEAVRRQQLETLASVYDRLLAIELDYDPEARAQPDDPILTSKEDVQRFFETLGTN